jgi:sugar O-acyltransferase (sialic acid O-acetyltransferase NeuD family)
MNDILIIGGGGYAREIIGILKSMSEYRLIGYTDVINKGKLLGIPYLGNDKELGLIKGKTKIAVLGIGQQQDPSLKVGVIKRYKSSGFKFPQIISTKAIVGQDVKLGEGTIIRDNAFLSVGVEVGKFSTISAGAAISYDTSIGSYSNVSLGALIGIDVNVGDEVLIGIGSIVMNRVKIMNKCLIGAGSLVTRDCEISGTYYGSPARIKKNV